MAGHAKIRRIYGGPVGKKIQVPVSDELLRKLGECMVKQFAHEAKKDFAKRGWSGQAQDGSSPIWESFSYRIVGGSTVEVTSTYPGLEQLVSRRGVQRRRMTWLTQEMKDKFPARYPLTAGERRRNMRRGGRVSKGERLPLVVPMTGGGGTVVYRTAPFKTQDAWVHPGIARFNFVERAARKGKTACIEILKREAAMHALRQGLKR